MATARKATVAMTYNGKSASQMAEYLSSFQFTDVASGSSDSISLTLHDRDRKWIGGWFPQKGDRLKPVLKLTDWTGDGKSENLSCGTFIVDEFSFKGGPIQLSLQGLAIPSTSGFKATERTYTYENTTLKEIGSKVAKRAGLTLYYEASAISIESVAQDNQTDCTFYNDLVVKYGLALKIYNDRLVVFNEATYEAQKVVATLTEADFEPDWTWDTTMAGTYTGVKYQYTNSDKNKVFTVTAGSGARILTVNEAANNLTEATLIALASLNNANKGTTTMKITLKAAKKIVATSCVQITGLGNLNGKYYVEQVCTAVGDGTKMSLTLRKVETRFKKATAISSSVAEESSNTTASASATATADSSSNSTPVKGGSYTLTVSKKGYYTAAEAKAGAATGGHPTGTVKAGTYTIYNISNGMLNLTTKAGTPGSWINPN